MMLSNFVADVYPCKYVKHDFCIHDQQDVDLDYCIKCLRRRSDEYFNALKEAELDSGYKLEGGN